MGNVPHDSMHRSCKVDLALIVHRHTYEELSFPHCAANILPKLVSFQHKIVGVASDGCVAHMREFSFISSRQETMQNRGNLAFEDELTVNKPHLLL